MLDTPALGSRLARLAAVMVVFAAMAAFGVLTSKDAYGDSAPTVAPAVLITASQNCTSGTNAVTWKLTNKTSVPLAITVNGTPQPTPVTPFLVTPGAYQTVSQNMPIGAPVATIANNIMWIDSSDVAHPLNVLNGRQPLATCTAAGLGSASFAVTGHAACDVTTGQWRIRLNAINDGTETLSFPTGWSLSSVTSGQSTNTVVVLAGSEPSPYVATVVASAGPVAVSRSVNVSYAGGCATAGPAAPVPPNGDYPQIIYVYKTANPVPETVNSSTLPFTGANIDSLGKLGMLALIIGAALVIGSKSRRRPLDTTG